jgi:hypothetical protein
MARLHVVIGMRGESNNWIQLEFIHFERRSFWGGGLDVTCVQTPITPPRTLYQVPSIFTGPEIRCNP